MAHAGQDRRGTWVAMIPDRRSLADVMSIAFDTETTDLFPIMHGLVEVDAVRFRLDGHELAAF
jgi:hypothetical protein